MKKSTIIRIILYSLLVLMVLFAYRHRISGLISELVCDDSVAELTMEQKLSDFNDLYDTLSESIPISMILILFMGSILEIDMIIMRVRSERRLIIVNSIVHYRLSARISPVFIRISVFRYIPI